MDKERIENAVREILLAVGEDPNRPVCWKHLKEWLICMKKYLPA